ncbi:winged helix-turn-helix domain-containing protein [Alishewanella sp. d11]|uniref:winged helix-turn-helix domain-containing protein n=1 Tax=Alishewanella sp. d11 TaxID=3414030 RepID=UPI003BF7DDAE
MIPTNRLKLGEFILCPVNQHLEYAEQHIPLEPKVYEVLCYLLTQPQRYVSLEELHQNVWQGRVVSDTAVRRTISKLRAALGDQGEVPRYIQSAAKRGYRWLPPIESADQYEPKANSTAELEPEIASDMGSASIEVHNAAKVEVKSMFNRSMAANLKRFTKPVTFFIGALCSGLLVFAYWFFAATPQPQWSTLEPLSLINGEKLSMAVSPDQRFLVFSSNAVNHYGQELYWYNLQSQELKQLTSGDNQIMRATFSADGKHLFYHNFDSGVYQLVQRPISEQGEFTAEGKVLLDNYVSMLQIWAHPDNESLFLNLGDATQINIQRLHLPTATLTPVTSSVAAGVQDSIFTVQTATQRLAFQRFFPGQGSSLIVQDMQSGKILMQLLYGKRIFDMHWVTEHELLIVDEEALLRFNLQTQQTQLLQHNSLKGNSFAHGLTRALVPLKDNQWLQFRHEGDVGRMIHQQGEVGSLAGRTYLHTAEHTRAVFFGQESQAYFLYNFTDGKQSLWLQHADGKLQPLIEIQHSNLVFQQQHSDGRHLLLLLDGKPTLFDLTHQKLLPLNVAGNKWLSARFSYDGLGIIMTSRQNNEYQSWLYHLDSGLSEKLYAGYQLLIPYKADSYLAVHPDSRFLLLNGEQVTELPIRYSPPYPGSVHVRGDLLFWAETDLKNTTLFRFNLATSALTQWQQDRRKMLQTFDISPDGSRWLVRHLGQFDTKVYRVTTEVH